MLFWLFPQALPKNFRQLALSKLVGRLISGPVTICSHFESLVHDSALGGGEMFVTIEARAGSRVSRITLFTFL